MRTLGSGHLEDGDPATVGGEHMEQAGWKFRGPGEWVSVDSSPVYTDPIVLMTSQQHILVSACRGV